MRIAVISDIHGNFEAFKEVLRDINLSEIDHIVNLGDSIGYGPEPEAVLNLIIKRNIFNILGNHEKAVLDQTYRLCFMQGAAKSIEQTKKFLTSASLLYLGKLPKSRILNRALFVHGCPPDSYTKYLNHLTFSDVECAFNSFFTKIAFVGHTHKFMLFSYDGEAVGVHALSAGMTKLDGELRYIVNTGSVGQPRDDDPRAGYIIWDTIPNNLEVKRIPYNIKSTADKIIKRGFQKNDADRLFSEY